MESKSLASKIGLVLGPVLFIIFQFIVQPEGMSESGRSVLACTLWVATWWTTEAIPMAATSLLPIVILPLTGGAKIDTVTAAYGNKILFLYMGGFIIAIAMEKWNLHKRIALTIISWVGTNSRGIVLGFIIATAFLSMWISNTATSLMMVTIGIALISQLGGIIDKSDMPDKVKLKANLGKALMLSIAYAASIGGMGTLIGTPTNVVFSAIAQQLFDIEISFALWMAFAMPLVVVLLTILWWYMVRVAYPLPKKPLAGGRKQIEDDLKELGKMSWEEKAVFAVFTLTAFSWITSSFLLKKVLPGLDDTIIAMSGALALFLVPAKSEANKMVMDWESAVKLPWGIIVLFGGGLALAAGFQESGLAEWIGQQMSLLEGVNLLLLIFIVALMLNFLTEVTSNVATASIMLPILAALSQSIGVHPFGPMIAATLAASCAFMLPIATPPNAIVFSFGHVEMKDMIRKGFALNLASTVLITLSVYFLMELVLGIDLSVNPF
jgi:solute carrier family 13 (sodium-dependent dicarboxylate transporter), member 2/3/5